MSVGVVASTSGGIALASFAVTQGRRAMPWYPLNTGVPEGTVLTTTGLPPTGGWAGELGDYFLSSDATYDSKIFRPTMTVHIQANVVLRNCRIEGQVKVESGSLLIEDSLVTGENYPYFCTPAQPTDVARGYGLYNMSSAPITARRVEISHWGKGAQFASNVLMEDCWVHSPVVGNCNRDGSPTHMEGLYVISGSNCTFLRNFIDTRWDYQGAAIPGNLATAAVLNTDTGTTHTYTYRNNIFAVTGAGSTVYPGLITNCTWDGNVFWRDATWRPRARHPSPVQDYSPGSGNFWINNTWSDDGSPVTQ